MFIYKRNLRWRRKILSAFCIMPLLACLFTGMTVTAAEPGRAAAETAAPETSALGTTAAGAGSETLAALEASQKELEAHMAQLLEYSRVLSQQQTDPVVWQQAAEAVQALQKQQEQLDAQIAAQKQAEAAALLAAQKQAEEAARLAAQQAEEAARLAEQQAAAAAQLAAQQAAAEAVINNAPDSFFKGKYVSILGDSISTYKGYIPADYACFYPDAENDVKDVSQTWWMQVINYTGMRLNVNGSYSASAVCGDSRGEDSSAGCSTRRIVELIAPDGTVPDVILVYMGANDFFHSIEIGDYPGSAVHRSDHYIWNFTEGYELMLQKLQAVYPASRIYCMTLIEANSSDHPRVNGNGDTIADYNRRIKEIAAAHNIPVIDVHNCGMDVSVLNRYTSDGTHPNKEGSAKMAAYVTNALLMGG